MSDPAKIFAVNTYSYTFDWTAADCIRHLADQGYPGFELMMYPGHLWPAEIDAADKRDILRARDQSGTRIVSFNMPNIDINIVGASPQMRDYSLGLLSQFVTLAGELEVPAIVIGPGKSNPLFAPSREFLVGHFFKALDHLYPIAKKGGVRLLVENMPFAFLPDAPSLAKTLDEYGNDDIGIIYDVANGYFINEDPRDGLRTVRKRLGLVHFSDTGKSVYRHDAVGLGDVPFADVPPVLAEIGYSELPVLEVISRNPDADTIDSARKLAALGYKAKA
jgi:sugar phosphate isomerase/epimerase